MNPIWIRYLPAPLRARVENRPVLRRILGNTGWLFADKMLRLSVGLFVGVWLARYLGPEQYGLMNYALAIVGLFGAVASLGLSGVVVRDLVTSHEDAGATLGTAFFLQFIGGALAFCLACATVVYARPDDDTAKWVVAVLGFALVFKATDVVKYWFESQVASRYVVWAESAIFLMLAAVKVWLILLEAPLMAFVWAFFAESALAALALLFVYAWRGGALSAWQVHSDRVRSLLRECWPLILSGLAIVVYMRIDQIMLGHMLGDEAVGIYSAAVRISEVWYFIPTAIVASVFPSIIAAKKASAVAYRQRLQKLYDLMVLLSLSVALPMTYFSGWIVGMVFGPDYLQAADVLAIHIWSGLFVFLSIASGKWFLVEGLAVLAFKRNLYGALLNVLMNFWLIPTYGAKGAAMATLVSFAVAGYLFDFSTSITRMTFIQKTKAIFVVFFLLKNLFSKRSMAD
ncbi:MAG: flippase [Thiobacillus sp.]